MSRLTQWQRDRVVTGILKDTFEARARALVKREAALAVRVILDRYGRDAFERFDAVSPGWLTTSKRFLVCHGNTNHYLNLEEARALPHELASGHFNIDDHPRCAARLGDLLAAQKQLSQDRNQLQRDVHAALAQFGTEAALRDGWPEGYAHLAVPTATTHPVPAVRVEDLNARIAMWQDWFAWYPVRAGGYSVGSRWYPRRWVWLQRVRWTEGPAIGEWVYLDPLHVKEENPNAL